MSNIASLILATKHALKVCIQKNNKHYFYYCIPLSFLSQLHYIYYISSHILATKITIKVCAQKNKKHYFYYWIPCPFCLRYTRKYWDLLASCTFLQLILFCTKIYREYFGTLSVLLLCLCKHNWSNLLLWKLCWWLPLSCRMLQRV